ncbi:hypothetical protein VD0004_g9492 [Verticillium dahliae]|nr:hypothetical protein VD0004_g9492 [Verticillium dahliae]PNH62963.1 hypothetical protein VD0001_g9301 [Verticillium dahliae]
MSQHALQGAHGSSSVTSASEPPRQHRQQSSSPTSSSSMLDDSPTTGRVLNNLPASSTTSLLSSPPTRSARRPIPSPLSLTAALSAASPSPSRSNFPAPATAPILRTAIPYSPTSPVDEPRSPREKLDDLLATERTYYQSDSSGKSTPDPTFSSPNAPSHATNDSRSVSDPVAPRKPAVIGLPRSPMPPGMAAGPSAASRAEPTKGAPRTSSMDSAISAATKTSSQKGSRELETDPQDIAGLIKTAGSPEAVIQYLLKEKQSQAQQNAQLWRLVDKQRAMILGLNKDLERSLKDKEKYRKKLKEVMSVPEFAKSAGLKKSGSVADVLGRSVPKVDVHGPTDQQPAAPDSPSLDSDSQKHSPTDLAMAPYPITPPADQPHNGPPSAVGEMLDPSHTMPKPQEHAYDRYDHEAEEKAEQVARQQDDQRQLQELPINLALPPSRSLPSKPPRMPPPNPPLGPHSPVAGSHASPQTDEGLAKFPAPPPRKAPPAPLQLNKEQSVILDEDETDSDFDDILQVNRDVDPKRGRRRTREEDDRMREILAQQEAERRSLSKKSKSQSQKSTPTEPEHPGRFEPIPPSPREIPQQLALQQNGPASLAGVLSGDPIQTTVVTGPLSPGLPQSPRPFGAAPSGNAISLATPRTGSHLQSAPLSPRPPRQPIPLPPGTPLASPPNMAGEPLSLKSPQPLAIMKSPETNRQANSDKPRASPTERSRVFKGFVSEEYPDLLLPPNALPSIQIKVASSRMKPSRASVLSLTQLEEDPVFTLAVFSRADGAELWRVEKDLASLAKLDQKLKNCSTVTIKAPDRALFSGHAPAKLDARRIALDYYLEEILETQLDQTAATELCKYLSTHTLPPNFDEASTPDIIESANARAGPGGRPFRSGYLTKRGKNFGGWKARFFVLDGPQLKYFEAPGGAHLGTIKLPHAQIGKQSQHNENQSPAPGANGDDFDNQYRHAFLVLEPKKKDSSSHVKHVLCAESDMERDQWVDALLRWIDYREPGEEDSRSGKDYTHDRHGSVGSERNMVKKKKGRPGVSNHQPSDSDSLIGVRYDSTSQGDLPHSAPGRPKTSGGPPEHPGHNEAAQAPMVISGPKDMHVISDSSSWGNKPQALPVPSYEEKKQRKRSFFGFGPKTTRSSGDGGSDGLFDGSSASTPPQGAGYQGPVRQVFGANLAEAVRYNSPVDVDVPLPAVVYRCIQYLDAKNAILEEGIFRLSGSNVVIKQIRERFNIEGDINLITDDAFYDIHAIASLLKLYLRELPTTILTRDLHNEFLSVTEMTSPKDKVAALNALVQRLPLANATLLKYLLAFLIRIINNADINKMTVRNVGIVFSPTLNIPAPVFAMFLQNYEPIFGVDAEEYELPSPSSASESSRDAPPPSAGLPRRPSDGQSARPGTTDHSPSPHRQRLMEAVTGQAQPRQGSTPPPLLQDLNAARGGTNSPQNFSGHRGMTYEPQYSQQQQQQQQQQQHYGRAGYEGGMGGPQGYEGAGYQQARGGYSAGPMDGGHGGYEQQQQWQQQKPNRRRESAIFNGGMMNTNQQAARSGLREETRF